MWIDVDELVRILSAGVNVVTSAVVHHRTQPRRRPRPDRRGVPARRLDDVRLRGQPGLRRAARHRRGDASATASTRSPSPSPPTPPSTTHPTPSGRSASAADRRPRPAGDDRARHRGVRRGGAAGRRRARRRARRGASATPSTRRPPRISISASWTIPAGCVAGVLRQLAGHSSAARPSSTSTCGGARARRSNRTGRSTRDGWKITDRRAADGHHAGRLPAAAGLSRSQDDRGLHGARPHHDRDAADPRDPGRRRRRAGHRDLQRSAAAAGPRRRADG